MNATHSVVTDDGLAAVTIIGKKVVHCLGQMYGAPWMNKIIHTALNDNFN